MFQMTQHDRPDSQPPAARSPSASRRTPTVYAEVDDHRVLTMGQAADFASSPGKPVSKDMVLLAHLNRRLQTLIIPDTQPYAGELGVFQQDLQQWIAGGMESSPAPVTEEEDLLAFMKGPGQRQPPSGPAPAPAAPRRPDPSPLPPAPAPAGGAAARQPASAKTLPAVSRVPGKPRSAAQVPPPSETMSPKQVAQWLIDRGFKRPGNPEKPIDTQMIYVGRSMGWLGGSDKNSTGPILISPALVEEWVTAGLTTSRKDSGTASPPAPATIPAQEATPPLTPAPPAAAEDSAPGVGDAVVPGDEPTMTAAPPTEPWDGGFSSRDIPRRDDEEQTSHGDDESGEENKEGEHGGDEDGLFGHLALDPAMLMRLLRGASMLYGFLGGGETGDEEKKRSTLMRGLWEKLPAEGEFFSNEMREDWLAMMRLAFKMDYVTTPESSAPERP